MKHSGTFIESLGKMRILFSLILITLVFSSIHANAQENGFLSNKIVVRFKQERISQNTWDYLKSKGVTSYERLLRMEQSLTLRKQKGTLQALTTNAERIVATEEPLLRTYILNITPKTPIPLLCEKLYRTCGDIEWAEPYYIQQVQGEFIPNDSLVKDQVMYEKLQAYQAWDIYKGDTNVLIGISDSGILQSHEDYEGTLYYNKKEIPSNGIDDDGNGYIDDWNGVNFAFKDDSTEPGNTKNTLNGHGSGVAGITSAVVNNKKGCAGVGFMSRFVPMKTMPNNLEGIIYGYQSIMYAAQNGIKVINLSWGGGPYSCIAQSVIDYAIANNVAIVAAAGNHGTSMPFYPAAFDGVLGVGVTEPNDTISDMSAFGSHLDIFAPGNQTWTTADDGTYTKFCCTSGAAPVVSGVVALVRGKYPELTPVQALEHVRLSTDNIESYNAYKKKYQHMIPGRINMYKALSRNPFALPSIRPVSWTYKVHGKEQARIIENDTVELNLVLKNHLGNAKELTYQLSTAEDTANVVQMLDSVTTMAAVAADAQASINTFRLVVTKRSSAPLFLRIDIIGKGATDSLYQDFFLLPCTPFEKHTTWKDQVMSFSLADNGRIGYAEPSSGSGGIGYQFKDFCNLLFEGGLMATESEEKRVVSCVRASNGYSDDFYTIKPYYGDTPEQSIVDDRKAADSLRLGLKFVQKVMPPKDSNALVYLQTTAKNISGRELKDVSIGYFLDFDIGTFADSNQVRLLPEAIPAALQGNAGALIVERPGDYPRIGVLSCAFDKNTEIQCAGLNNLTTYYGAGFTNAYKIQTLNSGTSQIWDGIGDVSVVSGIKFLGAWKPNESRQFITVFGADMSRERLAVEMRKLIDGSTNSVGDASAPKISFFPTPADNEIAIDIQSPPTVANVVVYSLLGTRVIERTYNIGHLSRHTMSVQSLASGMYIVVVNTQYGSITAPLIITH